MFILLCNFLSFLLAIQEFLSYIVSTASLVTHTGYIYIYALIFLHGIRARFLPQLLLLIIFMLHCFWFINSLSHFHKQFVSKALWVIFTSSLSTSFWVTQTLLLKSQKHQPTLSCSSPLRHQPRITHTKLQSPRFHSHRLPWQPSFTAKLLKNQTQPLTHSLFKAQITYWVHWVHILSHSTRSTQFRILSLIKFIRSADYQGDLGSGVRFSRAISFVGNLI